MRNRLIGPPADRVRVLDEDPTLGAGLTPRDLAQARRVAVAEVVHLGRGSHDPSQIGTPGMVGLLVLDGLIIHRIAVAGRQCGALIAPGELLRPCDHDGQQAPIPFENSWRVVQPARLALLDQHITATCTRCPPLLHELVGRAVQRSHALAYYVAIHCLEHVQARLLVLLWHLADQYGRVTPDGTLIPLKLSHADLAELLGSQRPSISSKLSALTRQGLVSRRPDRTWLLHGSPPQQLNDIRGQALTGTARRAPVPA